MENYVYSSPEMQEKIEAYLPRITEHRRDLLVKVVQNRTRHFCMVLEDLFDDGLRAWRVLVDLDRTVSDQLG